MEDIISTIIKIDNDTKELVERTDKIIEDGQRALKEELSQMESESLVKSKNLSQEKFDEIMKDAEEDIKVIEDKNNEDLKSIDKIYQGEKDKLIEEAFKKFILKENE